MIKKKTAMQAITYWCIERNLTYADFQCMETLGYLKIGCSGGDHYVMVHCPEMVERYTYDIRR